MADKSKVKISELSEELFAPYKNAKTKAKTDNVYNNWDFATNGLALDAISNNILSAVAAGASQGLSVLNRTPSNSVSNTGGSSVTSPNPNPSVYPTSEQVQSAMREYAVLKNQPKYDFTPSEYQLKYGETIENLLKQLNDRNNAGFSYDPSADPTLQEYFKQYDLQADAAIDKTIGTYAPAGGGMSSTALALANEAAAAYEAKKNALVPEFYNAAYNQYLNQNATLADLANSYLALENNNYNIWANNEEQRQAAALQQYERDYLKWLQDLDSIGYTVNELGQAVEKTDQSASPLVDDSLLNAIVNAGALGAQAGALAAEEQSNSKQNPFSTLYGNLEQLTGLDIERPTLDLLQENQNPLSTPQEEENISNITQTVFDRLINPQDPLKDLEENQKNRISNLSSMVDEIYDDDTASSFNALDAAVDNLPSSAKGFYSPSKEASRGWTTIPSPSRLLNYRNAKYTNEDFYYYFINEGYSESKAKEMADNVSKKYPEIDKLWNVYTADAIAYAIFDELTQNPIS